MRTERLKVTGMSCGGCVSSVTKALKAADGVDDVSVSLDEDEANVRYDGYVTTKALLKTAVFAAGYGVAEQAGRSKAGRSG